VAKDRHPVAGAILCALLLTLLIITTMLDPLLGVTSVLGLMLGFVLQRGRYCGASVLSSAVIDKDRTPLVAVGLGISVSMIGIGIVGLVWNIHLREREVFPVTMVVSGALFGIGMVLAGGCTSGSLFKASEGRLTSILAVVGMGFGVSVQSIPDVVRYLNGVTGPVATPRASNLVGLIAGILVTLALGLWLWRDRKRKQAKPTAPVKLRDRFTTAGWPIAAAGVAVGLLSWAALLLSNAQSGTAHMLGPTRGFRLLFADISSLPLPPRTPVRYWTLVLVLGLIVGAAGSAWLRRDLKVRSADPSTLLVALGGGVLVGFGATVGHGCFLGNIVGGVASLSVAAMLFAVVAIIANWVTTALYIRGLS
jgi:uncharacterized membrane protein YedE/YeeE